MDHRVGYATIDILFKETMGYIKAHTIEGKYQGRLDYLEKAYQMREYLKRDEVVKDGR